MQSEPNTHASVASETADDTGKLSAGNRLLGLPSATLVVAASMIGAGIYTTSGFSLASLGSPATVIWAWIVGGVIAISGAITYGGLAARYAESGGEYLFLARGVHPAAGMMAGWVSLLAGFTGAMAFAASTFESHLRLWSSPLIDAMPQGAFAVGLIVIAALIHATSLRGGAWTQDAVVIAKLLMIALFLGLAFSVRSLWLGLQEPALPEPGVVEQAGATHWWPGALAFASALTWISLSYSGFNGAVYLSEQIKQPRRNVPRAMLLGTTLVTVLYVLLNLVFMYLPSADQVTGQQDIAARTAESLGERLTSQGLAIGQWVGPMTRVMIILGLITSVLALTQTGPRVYQKMSSDGLMPAILRGKSAETGSEINSTETLDDNGLSGSNRQTGQNDPLPRIAIALQACLANVVVLTTRLSDLLGYLGFTLSLCAAICGMLSLWVGRKSDLKIRVWGHPWVPLLYLGGTLTVLSLTALRSPAQALVGLGTLAVGLVFWAAWGRRNPIK